MQLNPEAPHATALLPATPRKDGALAGTSPRKRAWLNRTKQVECCNSSIVAP